MLTVAKSNKKKIEQIKNSKKLKEFFERTGSFSSKSKSNKKQKLLKLDVDTINLLKVVSALEGKSQSEFVESLIDEAIKKYIDKNFS